MHPSFSYPAAWIRLPVVAFVAALATCCSHPASVPVNNTVVANNGAPTREVLPANELATSPRDPAQAARVQAVDAAERAPEDRALDRGRNPLALLDFAGVKPGDRVAELMAGGGYTAELLARVVGPQGQVYGQNSPLVLQRFAEKPWSERLAKPIMAHTVRVDRDLDDPLPPEAHDLDAIFLVLFYHDAVWQKVDRPRMNTNILRALRPGGVFVVVDHQAAPGHGFADVETLHRIDEDAVKSEILAAGFRLDAEGTFLRNPSDTRDWSTSPRVVGERRGTSDRFVLRFVRP